MVVKIFAKKSFLLFVSILFLSFLVFNLFIGYQAAKRVANFQKLWFHNYPVGAYSCEFCSYNEFNLGRTAPYDLCTQPCHPPVSISDFVLFISSFIVIIILALFMVKKFKPKYIASAFFISSLLTFLLLLITELIVRVFTIPIINDGYFDLMLYYNNPGSIFYTFRAMVPRVAGQNGHAVESFSRNFIFYSLVYLICTLFISIIVDVFFFLTKKLRRVRKK